MYSRLIVVVLCLAGAARLVAAQPPAFPGAEGAGAQSLGGRGGAVLYVTTLADSGPGSLREVVAAKGPRTILFKVSGTLELKKGIRVTEPFVTIAGQSAPGDGICLKDFPLLIDTHDVVVRYLRVRPGDASAKELDAISINTGSQNVIVDHCSATWGTDELISVSGTNIHNVTVQWCIIAESLNHSVHSKGDHGYGSLIRADGDVTYHHNLYAHNKSRNPRPGSYGTGRGLLLDFRNNVIYDWGERAGYSSEDPAMVNYVGNYLKAGPSTHRKDEAFNVGGDTTRLFVEGNVYEGNAALNADNWKMIGRPREQTRSEKPFPIATMKTDAAPEAFSKVLAGVGASQPKRDAADARLVNEVRTGGGRIIDKPSEGGGWPDLRSTTAPVDSDGDGLPDTWEQAHQLNPKDAADGARVARDGYTNLELYLHSLTEGSP